MIESAEILELERKASISLNMESMDTIGSRPPSNTAGSVPSVYSAWDAAIALSAPWLNNPEIGTIQRMPPKRIMYAQGDVHDCFYLIRSGFVHTIVTRPDGSSLLLEISSVPTLSYRDVVSS